jgi:hypothetical protein
MDSFQLQIAEAPHCLAICNCQFALSIVNNPPSSDTVDRQQSTGQFRRSGREGDAMPEPAPVPRRPLRRALYNWRLRHQHPFNFAIHLLGIPLAVTGVVLFFVLPWDEWYWGAGVFVLGYVLQWLGHQVEGNDVGEWAGIKRLLGLPYVGIAPQYLPKSDALSPSPPAAPRADGSA